MPWMKGKRLEKIARSVRVKSLFVSLSAVVLALFLSANADAISFHLASSPAVGDTPYSVAAGDFDGDGNADLVVGNWFSDNISILLGNGNGTFAAAVPPTYTVGTSPTFVAVGSFNTNIDSYPDLVVVNSATDDVSVLLGVGDGTFASSVNYGVGTAPISVAIGDFSGDGKQDLAVANSTDISILLGNGSGAFAAVVPTTTAGTSPMAVAVGYFNTGTNLDLAVANYDSHNVSILLGNGNGTFAAAVNYPVGTNPVSIAVGDFNNDGKTDLAVANLGSDDVSILLGNGDGTFQPAVNYPVGTSPQSVVACNFYGVGSLIDLVVANSGSDNVSVLIGLGDGTFAPAVNFPAGTTPMSAVVGNFAGSGSRDIAVANSIDNNVSILLKSGVDLSVAVAASPNPALWGHDVTYTLTVLNSGTPATGVVLTDTLLAGTTFVSADSTQGSCLQAAGVVTCSIGDMAALQTVIVTIVATAPGTPGTATNSVMLAGVAAGNPLVNSTTSQGTGEYPVRIFPTAPTGYYTAISGAYALMVHGDEIQAQRATYAEALDLARPAITSVTLKGGYGSGFSEPGPSDYSTIMGSLTVTAGTLTVQGIIIQ